MTKPAISLQQLSKRYRLGSYGAPRYRTLRETIAHAAAAPWRSLRRLTSSASPTGSGAPNPSDNGAVGAQTIWALKDISFDVPPGEVLGVIGRNGAGKSTLLKIISRITEPTAGRVELRGRVGSLLEVGAGFHTELSGRENIYLSGAILGMSRREIARKFDAIVSFAEVEPFLDTPVKRYSSGMFVRLAFAVACHMEPEILLVDEVLAIGDAAFQKKCLGKMHEVGQSGRTVIFVSHNMASILHLCRTLAVLHRGGLIYLGGGAEGVRQYLGDCGTRQGGEVDFCGHPNRRSGSSPILARIRLLNHAGQVTDQLPCGEPAGIELWVEPPGGTGELHLAIGFDDARGCRLFTSATYLSASVPPAVLRERRAICHLDQLPLVPGRYGVTLNAGPVHAKWTDVIDQAIWFDVIPSDFYGNGRLPNPDWGQFLMRSRWEAVGQDGDAQV